MKNEIKANKNKFQLSVSAGREVVVDQERISFKNKITIVGMEFGTRGSIYTKRRFATAMYQYTKLKRFK